MNQSLLGLAAAITLTGGSHASVILDNFESYSPVFGDMNGQGSWVVSNGNPAVGPEGPVVIIDSYTWDGSNQSATVGGIQPTFNSLTSLSHSANLPLVSTTGVPTSFKIETAYTESTEGFRNDFQFVLTATSGNLLTIVLTPGAIGEYDIEWSSSFAAGGLVGSKMANTSTQFQLDTWWNGSAVAYSLTNVGDVVSNGVLAGAAANDLITGFSVNWDSNSNGGFGNNSITIDNVSLIPEPTTALLGLLGASFAFRRRRA